jgi:hypothetical protein
LEGVISGFIGFCVACSERDDFIRIGTLCNAVDLLDKPFGFVAKSDRKKYPFAQLMV